ncbi:methyl-accepting chemotaxis protein [Alsobacter sp. KACC 23698]|uniref:Methyl-accepting chemotaxis protein n=1 Tax=Alsobacter sp. KACC 23698 TaxID=3149229 RepID=A0AAU7JGU5_9HYPH
MLSRIRRSMGLQITLGVLATCLATAALVGGLSYSSMRESALLQLDQEAVAGRDRAVLALDELGSRVLSHATSLAINPDVIAAIRSKDPDLLRATMVRIFEDIRRFDPNVWTLEATDAQGVVLMRGHNPKSLGDNKAGESYVKSALQKQPVRGLTVSSTSGELAEDGVAPVLADGALVGTVKVGAYLRGKTAVDIKRVAGVETLIVVGQKLNASSIEGVEALSLPPLSDQGSGKIDVNGRTYRVGVASLKTSGSANVQVVAMLDQAHTIDELNEFVLAFVLKSLAVLAALTPVIIVVTHRFAARTARLTTAMTAIAKGDLATTVHFAEREDELGAMARAVGVFRDNALKMRSMEAQDRAAEAEQVARAEAMTSVVNDVAVVVAAAAAGDFSARLEISNADGELRRLVQGINEINAAVDHATTEFAAVLGYVAEGDLTRTVETTYQGRFADLKTAVNDTIARLASAVSTIQVAAVDVGEAVKEINSGADDLSQRTEEQAASLEQTAATTEELAASVKASAQSSRQAVDLARQAIGVAETGGGVVTEAVAAMTRIEQASQKITDISSVIDDIAFQTNLLALNAAVEAARAGEAGKGFAVVASEVRTLSQRSSDAAKEITDLINSSTQEVAQGVKLVRSAGEALGRIVDASRRVASTVEEISSAASEQANGVDEMSKAVAHMDEMTQQNAALAEESAASASSLASQIERLNEVVATFRTGAGDARRDSAMRPQRAAARVAPPAARRSAPPPRPKPAAAGSPSSEPERLRQLAEQAFVAPAPAASRPRPEPTAARVKAAGSGSGGGWEEF